MMLARRRHPVLASATLTATIALAGAGCAEEQPAAGEPEPITVEPLGAFTTGDVIGYPSPYTFNIEIPPGGSVATYRVRFEPGAEFPFHHHDAAVAATVVSGTLTIQDPTSCETQEFTAGEGFVEEPDAPHRAYNAGEEAVEFYVTYLGVAAGDEEDIFEAPEFDPC